MVTVMDGADGTTGSRAWDSALSVEAFAAVRSVGFEPVGQVFGAVVYYLATVAGVSCPGTTGASYPPRDESPAGRLGRACMRDGGRRSIGWPASVRSLAAMGLWARRSGSRRFLPPV